MRFTLSNNDRYPGTRPITLRQFQLEELASTHSVGGGSFDFSVAITSWSKNRVSLPTGFFKA